MATLSQASFVAFGAAFWVSPSISTSVKSNYGERGDIFNSLTSTILNKDRSNALFFTKNTAKPITGKPTSERSSPAPYFAYEEKISHGWQYYTTEQLCGKFPYYTSFSYNGTYREVDYKYGDYKLKMNNLYGSNTWFESNLNGIAVEYLNNLKTYPIYEDLDKLKKDFNLNDDSLTIFESLDIEESKIQVTDFTYEETDVKESDANSLLVVDSSDKPAFYCGINRMIKITPEFSNSKIKSSFRYSVCCGSIILIPETVEGGFIYSRLNLVKMLINTSVNAIYNFLYKLENISHTGNLDSPHTNVYRIHGDDSHN